MCSSDLSLTLIDPVFANAFPYLVGRHLGVDDYTRLAREHMCGPGCSNRMIDAGVFPIMGGDIPAEEVSLNLNAFRRANGRTMDSTELFAWQSFCQSLFCLNEFIYLE